MNKLVIKNLAYQPLGRHFAVSPLSKRAEKLRNASPPVSSYIHNNATKSLYLKHSEATTAG
jgi:hypothetical protein